MKLMKLLITIPAYNEESSIHLVITRTLQARNLIIASTCVSDVDINVVSDGSTDRTVELARQFGDQIKLFVLENNKGYGAAIKTTWKETNTDLLGFLDADGTCDPHCFSQLCEVLVRDHADLVIGSRMNRESKMPWTRKIGNLLFGLLLSLLSGERVRDATSGMRVLRREKLAELLPLPDGLDFTTAMSAKALLKAEIKVVEVQIPYHERSGASKLHIFKDGARFLRVIMESAFLYRPYQPLCLMGILSLIISSISMLIPPTTAFWIEFRWSIAFVAMTNTVLMFSAAHLVRKMKPLVLRTSPTTDSVSKFMAGRKFWCLPLLLVLAGSILVVFNFTRNAVVSQHWQGFAATSFFFTPGLILISTWVLDYLMNLMSEELSNKKSRSSA